MEDGEVRDRIEALVAEEQGIWVKEAAGDADDHDRRRLDSIAVSLDQCWDLLRQRRARRAAGTDPDRAEVRSRATVERYEQ